MATMGFLVVLATVFTELTRAGATRFFLTTVTKSPPEGFIKQNRNTINVLVLVAFVLYELQEKTTFWYACIYK
jgi:hypothetical protein